VPAEEIRTEISTFGEEAIDELARHAYAVCRTPQVAIVAHGELSKALDAWAMRKWQLLLSEPHQADRLEEGSLILAQWADPGKVDVHEVRAILQRLGAEARAMVSAHSSLEHRVAAVNRVLFSQYGLQGTEPENYFKAENSFIHKVLERRVGIPISLSIVWTCVARQLEISCYLCSDMPQHILIRVDNEQGPEHDLYIDAFAQATMSFEDLLLFLRQRGIPYSPDFLRKREPCFIYARMLRNLRNIYGETRSAEDMPGRIRNLEALSGCCSQFLAIVQQQREERDHLSMEGEHVAAVATRSKDQARKMRSILLVSSSSGKNLT